MAGHEDKTRNPLKNGDVPEDMQTLYSLDMLIRKLGQCGPFQVLFVSLAYFPLVPAAWGLVFMMFGNYNPGLECGGDSLVYNSASLEQTLNTTQGRNQSDGNFIGNRTSLCTCDTIKSHQNWTFNKAASTVVTEWSLICEDSWKSSAIISVQMFGVLLGSCAGGQIGDKFGRKFSVHGGAAVLAVFNILGIFSVSWTMYAVVNFFMGFAGGCMLATTAVYIMEFIPSFWRVFMGTFPFWNIASFSFGLCVMALKNWKHVHIAAAFVAFLAFLPVFWLPESLRFLTVHGHLKQANKVVKKMAKLNRTPLPDTSIVKRIAAVEKESLKERSSYNYLHLFHRSIRKKAIVLGTIWFIFSVTSSTIGFGLNALSGDFFVNLLVFCVLPFPVRLCVLLAASKVGRKPTLVTSICFSSICSFVIVPIQLSASPGPRDTATTALALVVNMFIESGWGLVLVLTVELFPTGVRNMALAFCCSLARIGGSISPYLMLKQVLPLWGVFLLIGILLLISCIAILVLPESKGRALQDNLEVKVNKTQDMTVLCSVE